MNLNYLDEEDDDDIEAVLFITSILYKIINASFKAFAVYCFILLHMVIMAVLIEYTI